MNLLELLQFKPFLSLVIVLLMISIFIFLCKKYKLTRYQILIFSLMTTFWLATVIFRSYRKVYAIGDLSIGGLGLGEIAAVSITSIYGLISIFLRFPILIFSDIFKSRKFFIALTSVIIGITSILVYLYPTYTTMFCSSLAIGIGASLLSLFNVMFADSFDKKDAILSVSILSIAPLIAEFLVAPIQYYFTSSTPKDYGTLWLFSSIFTIMTLIMLFFIKDNKDKIVNFTKEKFLSVLKNKEFLMLCILGIFISLIKFATTGANYVAFVSLSEINMSSLGIAYLDVIFSLAQLIAGVLIGTSLRKKYGSKTIIVIGLLMSLMFTILPLVITNSVILFISYILSGFSYGLTYNILIGLSMQPFDKNKREISMGIYQTFFAIGIYYGDKIYGIIYKLLEKRNLYLSYQNVFGLISGITILVILYIIIYFSGKRKDILN